MGGTAGESAKRRLHITSDDATTTTVHIRKSGMNLVWHCMDEEYDDPRGRLFIMIGMRQIAIVPIPTTFVTLAQD